MELKISYFYQIRNFPSHFIPVSTACWDPAWYHEGLGENHIFLDKRGVINGLRALPLHPGKECEGLCLGRPCLEIPEQCRFLKAYRQQLDKIDITILQQDFTLLKEKVKSYLNLKIEPVIVLIVYEAPDNPCGERQVLIDYFNSKSMNCEELKYPIQ